MTLDKAIKTYQNSVEWNEEGLISRSQEFRTQILKWLKELKMRRNQKFEYACTYWCNIPQVLYRKVVLAKSKTIARSEFYKEFPKMHLVSIEKVE